MERDLFFATFTDDQRANIDEIYGNYRTAIQELEELTGQTAEEFREPLRQRQLAKIGRVHREQLSELFIAARSRNANALVAVATGGFHVMFEN